MRNRTRRPRLLTRAWQRIQVWGGWRSCLTTYRYYADTGIAARFRAGHKMTRALADLQWYFDEPSKADVLRKAVALLKVVADMETADGEVLLLKDGVYTRLVGLHNKP